MDGLKDVIAQCYRGGNSCASIFEMRKKGENKETVGEDLLKYLKGASSNCNER